MCLQLLRESGSLLTPSELAGWRGMLRVHAALMKELDTDLAAGHGLSLSTYEVLLFLADAPDGKMRMAQLADSVLLSRSGLTRLVDRLERAGLVEREPCPSDQRGFNALITAEGREVFDAARQTHLSGVRERFLSHFSRGGPGDDGRVLGSRAARARARRRRLTARC